MLKKTAKLSSLLIGLLISPVICVASNSVPDPTLVHIVCNVHETPGNTGFLSLKFNLNQRQEGYVMLDGGTKDLWPSQNSSDPVIGFTLMQCKNGSCLPVILDTTDFPVSCQQVINAGNTYTINGSLQEENKSGVFRIQNLSCVIQPTH